jgi:hypothetical protein
MAEKGENLATKEDTADITQKIDQIKESLGSRLHIHQTRASALPLQPKP